WRSAYSRSSFSGSSSSEAAGAGAGAGRTDGAAGRLAEGSFAGRAGAGAVAGATGPGFRASEDLRASGGTAGTPRAVGGLVGGRVGSGALTLASFRGANSADVLSEDRLIIERSALLSVL